MSIQQRVVRFGTFEFNLETLDLTRQGRRVAIEPQPAKALALLVAGASEIVSREALKRAVWPDDVHVDFDRGLAYVMSQVRGALGDSAENPRFVETIPKKGFRFIAPVQLDPSGVQQSGVQELDRAPSHVPNPKSPGSLKPRNSRSIGLASLALVAVLIAAVTFALVGKRPVLAIAVFDNETGQAAHDGFTRGVADALVAHIGKLDTSRIGVIGNARTLRMPRSDRDLDQIKTETGASFILLGQLQNHEGGLRLITHLIRLDDGTHIWVKRFDRPAGNLDGLEAEVLSEVEAGVRLRIIEGVPKPTPSSTPPPSR